ncbi:hypothetical protein L6R52_04345 [Myxococcota bacterium]|nr:hypothetical protein [Myxococcota bacterium]
MAWELDPVYVGLALAALVGIVLLLVRPAGLFSGGGHRLPKHFTLEDVPGRLPRSTAELVAFLSQKLGSLGFTPADLPVRVPALSGRGRSLLFVPYVNVAESTFFLMGIEQSVWPRPELMLHILTPFVGGKRVETSTLAILAMLVHPPETVALKIVLDAESVEEIYSRHRLALGTQARADRAPVRPEEWRQHAAAAYEAWLQSAVRAQRLQLESNGETYRIRARPKSVV